jgi:hypothetical protein
MNVRFIPILLFALALSACRRGSQADILVGTTGPTTSTTYAVAECTAKDAQGRCVQATCRADENSDCELFAEICLDYDFHYEGTREKGTCSLIL